MNFTNLTQAQQAGIDEHLRSQKNRSGVFYILWNPASSRPPTVQFDTYEAAVEVAQDMARRHSETFYVMQTVARCEVTPVPVVTTVLA